MDGSRSLTLAAVCGFLALSLFGASEIAPLHGQFGIGPAAHWVLKGISVLAGFGALCYLVYGVALGTDVTRGSGRP